MSKFHIALLALLLICVNCKESNSQTQLFSEHNQDWIMQGDAQWTIDKKVITAKLTEGSGFLMTKIAYKNFVLELEFKPDSTINSGVFIRCSQQALSHEDCYEINIWDEHPVQEWRTGAIVGRASPVNRVNTIGKWNSYKIECTDQKIRAWINDTITVQLTDSDLKKGYIAIQAAESGTISFRNIRITVIDP